MRAQLISGPRRNISYLNRPLIHRAKMALEQPEQSQRSLSERLMPLNPVDMEITDEANPETDLDGTRDAPYSVSDAVVMPDQDLEESMAEAGRNNLENRIAKNRLYTRDETAPDVPETRVPSRVRTVQCDWLI